LLDMIDGGGMGRAGQRFEGGGLLSDIANALARPAGYMDRMGAVRPQARPMQAPMQAGGALPDMPMIQPPMGFAPPPVTTGTLPPAGAMPNDQLIQMLINALQMQPSSIGYGPR
jgi:hypothetical protein